jgi:hypothetical protein
MERVQRHHAAAHRLSAIALSRTVAAADLRFVRERAARSTFLRGVDAASLLDAFSG